MSCGYARSAIKEAFVLHQRGDQTTNRLKRYIHYKEVFGDHFKTHSQNIDIKYFSKKSKDLVSVINCWLKSNTREADEYLTHFSAERWKALSEVAKSGHTLR